METDSLSDEVKGRLKEALGKKTQEQIAEESGIPKGSLSKYLAGDQLPGSGALIKFSAATGYSIHYLLTGKGPKDRRVVEAIKNGEVDIEQIKREFLIQHHMAEARKLVKQDSDLSDSAEKEG